MSLRTGRRSESPIPDIRLGRLQLHEHLRAGRIERGDWGPHAPATLAPLRPYQTLTQKDHSVLSLAATAHRVFSGSQSSCIHVWNATTFLHIGVLSGHQGGIFSLRLSRDEKMLVSASGDGTVRVWDVETLKCLFVVDCGSNVGDILSIALSDELQTVYIGCQNTSIQWFRLDAVAAAQLPSSSHSPVKMTFFSAEEQPPLPMSDGTAGVDSDAWRYSINETEESLAHAHFGYVYTLMTTTLPESGQRILVSGSGDGTVKIWKLHPSGRPEPFQTLQVPDAEGVSCLCASEGLLLAGTQHGDVKVWDLESFRLVRSITAHDEDVLTITPLFDRGPLGFFTGAADGSIKRWDRNFDCTNILPGHDGIVLSSVLSGRFLISGGSDNLIKFWDVMSMKTVKLDIDQFDTSRNPTVNAQQDELLDALAAWVEYPTVSGMHALKPQYVEECRRGAKYLKTLFRQLGAESRMVYTDEGINPLVIAKFASPRGRTGKQADARPLHVLIYGHYDVVPVDEKNWRFPPFQINGEDGYIYGRGVTDDKGPVLAMAFAVHELFNSDQWNLEITFLVEGEEENGSAGFADMVLANREYIGNPDVILVSNAYWLGEDIPCITYGLRGNIKGSFKVTSNVAKDLHSGVDGGVAEEPLQLLIQLLSKLRDDSGNVLVPGFSETVKPVTVAEDKMYDDLATLLSSDASDRERLKMNMMQRWRFPTLTVHSIETSTSSSVDNGAVIPHCAIAKVTIRTVPNQRGDDIAASFETHARSVFSSFGSQSALAIEMNRIADWWLGDVSNRYFRAMEAAVLEEWKQKPLYIREGGSIPGVRWLEKTFNTVALNLPMGQSSDSAHLSNERIRLQNLLAGRRVVKSFLARLSTDLPDGATDEA